METYLQAVSAVLQQLYVGEVTKIEGRIKNKHECVKKFERKYQAKPEISEQPYSIKNHISDLIGIRIVCLYEDQINRIAEALGNFFEIIDVTDKISAIESTEDLFGYKGLHMDLKPSAESPFFKSRRQILKLPVEVQIRSLIQDTWSVLDHKIKYKKSIPNDLKRRINVLSALFELADREFKEIRDATTRLLEEETKKPISDRMEEETDKSTERQKSPREKTINAFNFLRIAGHFYNDFIFEDYKVDNFVQDILKLDQYFEKAQFHTCLTENIKQVKEYRQHFLISNPEGTFSPYTSIRHCLYLYERVTFERLLSKGPRLRFQAWINDKGTRLGGCRTLRIVTKN